MNKSHLAHPMGHGEGISSRVFASPTRGMASCTKGTDCSMQCAAPHVVRGQRGSDHFAASSSIFYRFSMWREHQVTLSFHCRSLHSQSPHHIRQICNLQVHYLRHAFQSARVRDSRDLNGFTAASWSGRLRLGEGASLMLCMMRRRLRAGL